jgi:hypothetical protein
LFESFSLSSVLGKSLSAPPENGLSALLFAKGLSLLELGEP